MCMHEDEDIEEILGKAKSLTPKENRDVVVKLVRDWSLGPRKTSVVKTDNKDYWKKIAGIWYVTEAEARRRLCSNCEYAENNVEFIEAMEHIPNSAFDLDGGGRVWCDKFNFICHNLRTCQAWEPKD